MTARILITGGLGYVGSRVARFLADSGRYELLLGTRRSGIPGPEWLRNGTIIPFDVVTDDLAPVCRDVDQIIHLAAVNEIESSASPLHALRVNGEGTVRLLNAALQSGVKRFLYFSTAHVYGAPLAGTISETTLARPVHPYAITHRVAEDFVLAEQAKGSIEGIVVRLSNGFGTPEREDVDRWTLLVNDLCRQAVTSQRLTLRSSGAQLRDFVTLHDVARASEHLLQLSRGSLQDGLFNLGGENAMSVHQMTILIRDRCEVILGFRPDIHRPSPDPNETVLPIAYQIEKLKRTGFALTGNIIAEIDNTLRFCQLVFSGVDAT